MQYMKTSCHDYKIVNVIHEILMTPSHHLMSTFELREQASPISEGVTEIRINSHLAREK
jgi:hypothetical protein